VSTFFLPELVILTKISTRVYKK